MSARVAVSLVVLSSAPGCGDPARPLVDVGYVHTCAIVDGRLWCWGANNNGYLGDGTTEARPTPTEVGGADWASLSVGDFHTCAIKTDQTLWCWGDGRRVAGTDEAVLAPMQIGGADWDGVDAGADHTCAIKTDGTLWCWGFNCTGGLGDGSFVARGQPVQAGDASNWSKVTAGAGLSCAIDEAGSAWCWGAPDFGDCAQQDQAVILPTKIDGTWVALSSHFYGVHGIMADGTLWRIWSDDDPDGTFPFGAVQVGSSTWRAVDTALGSPCGIRTDGTLACTLETTSPTEPTPVGEDTDWGETIAAGYHACAFKQDRGLWCWGRNDSGQLGDATTVDRAAPIQVVLPTTANPR